MVHSIESYDAPVIIYTDPDAMSPIPGIPVSSNPEGIAADPFEAAMGGIRALKSGRPGVIAFIDDNGENCAIAPDYDGPAICTLILPKVVMRITDVPTDPDQAPEGLAFQVIDLSDTDNPGRAAEAEQIIDAKANILHAYNMGSFYDRPESGGRSIQRGTVGRSLRNLLGRGHLNSDR